MATHGAPSLLTVDGVATALATSRSTVRRLVNRGELLPVRIGGITRFRVADVQALVERHAPENVEGPTRTSTPDTAPLDRDERRDPA